MKSEHEWVSRLWMLHTAPSDAESGWPKLVRQIQADAVRSLAEHFREVSANDPPVGMPGAYLEETIIEIIETRAKKIEEGK